MSQPAYQLTEVQLNQLVSDIGDKVYKRSKSMSDEDAVRQSLRSQFKKYRVENPDQIAIKALKQIANPMQVLLDEAEEQGATVDGRLALDITQNASHLQFIAKKALREIEELKTVIPSSNKDVSEQSDAELWDTVKKGFNAAVEDPEKQAEFKRICEFNPADLREPRGFKIIKLDDHEDAAKYYGFELGESYEEYIFTQEELEKHKETLKLCEVLVAPKAGHTFWFVDKTDIEEVLWI